MFGWEFPPISSGGLGTACYGLTKGLSHKGADVIFVLPYLEDLQKADFVRLIPAMRVRFRKIDSLLSAYENSVTYSDKYRSQKSRPIYGSTLFAEVARYSLAAKTIALEEDFDIIHCHDWMTYGAGITAKNVSGKPLIVHVHATEFDRTASNDVNQNVYDIEREGMHAADAIICVSNFTRKKVIDNYGVPPEKVYVAHNAVEFTGYKPDDCAICKDDKVVLFLGRLTIQKGPDYFLYAAKKVLEIDPNVKFVIAGSGDMERFIIEKTAELGISQNVLFSGFLRGDDVDKIYKMADVYVMPSVSEPFGITPLEAMRNNTPVIISKQSGVSEVIDHCLKVDFWDVDQLANKIVSVLSYSTLHNALKYHGSIEVSKFNWDNTAEKCINVYNKILNGG